MLKIIKIEKEINDYILFRAMCRNETFSQSINSLLREKINENTEKYMEEVEKALG